MERSQGTPVARVRDVQEVPPRSSRATGGQVRIRGKASKRRRGLPVAVAIAFVVATLTTGLAANTASGQAEAVPPNTAYVQQVFQDLLGRAVDPGGLNYWTGLLNAGVPRSAVSWSLVNSDEYRGDVIAGMYQSYLNRRDRPRRAALLGGPGRKRHDLRVVPVDPDRIGRVLLASREGQGQQHRLRQVDVPRRARPQRRPGRRSTTSSRCSTRDAARRSSRSSCSAPEHLGDDRRRLLPALPRPPHRPGGQNYWVGQLQAGARDETIVSLIIGSDEYYLRANGGHLPPPTTTTTTTAPRPPRPPSAPTRARRPGSGAAPSRPAGR